VQLLVTVLQRVWRMLSEEEQQHYSELFAPYLKGHAGQYVDTQPQARLCRRKSPGTGSVSYYLYGGGGGGRGQHSAVASLLARKNTG